MEMGSSLVDWNCWNGLVLKKQQENHKGEVLSRSSLCFKGLSRRRRSLGTSPWHLPIFSATSNPLPSHHLTNCFVSFLLASALTPPFISPPSPSDTLQNVPSSISGTEKARRIQKPNSAKAESCTRKCVGTCIRGGGGAPGEGPLNVRRPLVVFKEGFRSRQYCLVECSEICNLIGDGDDGP